MEAIKEILTVIGAIVGVVTGLVTLYAKYLDLKKKAAREARQPTAVRVLQAAGHPAEFDEPMVVELAPDPAGVARARQRVKGPAIALMVAGALSLMFNVLTAGYGFVDEFVTPLNAETSQRRAAEAARMADTRAFIMNGGIAPAADAEQGQTLMTIVLLLCISFASAGAIWSGYSMLNLRSYWLSVAGSFAVMPGACFCCAAGLPIGIWSLVVLLNPEVSEHFG